MPAKVPKAITATQKKIAEICDKAIAAMQKHVLEHYQQHPDSAWSGHYLVDLEKTIKGVYRSMGIDIGGAFRDGLTDNMQAMYDKAVEDMKTMGLRHNLLGKPNTTIVKNYMESSFEQVAMRTTKMSFEHIRALRSMSADVLRTASLTGASRADITREFLARAQEIPGFKFTAANGAEWSNKAYFTMLARTELMNAGRAAYDQKCADEGCDVVELDYSGNCCEACARWEGKQFSLTGATKGLPTKADLEEDGVFHPNCTHRYTVVPNWDAVEQAAEEAKKEDEAEEERERKERQQQEEQGRQEQRREQQEQKPEAKPEPKPEPRRKTEPEPVKPADKDVKADEEKVVREIERQADEMADQAKKAKREATATANQDAEQAKREAEAHAKETAEEKAKREEEHREEHRKHREEQRDAAFKKRKENLRKESEEAAKQGANDPNIVDEFTKEARKEARNNGLSGAAARTYVQQTVAQKIREKTAAFLSVASEFTKQYTPKIAKIAKPPKLIFGERANSIKSSHFDPVFDHHRGAVVIKTIGADTAWHQCKGCVRHEFGHWAHFSAMKKDPGLAARIRAAAQSDWNRLRTANAKSGQLASLSENRCSETMAQGLYGKHYWELDLEERYNVMAASDTIGSICDGTGYGAGHYEHNLRPGQMNYYQQQNNMGHAYTEAIANIRALKKAFPDAILNHLFPELNKIVKEIEY